MAKFKIAANAAYRYTIGITSVNESYERLNVLSSRDAVEVLRRFYPAHEMEYRELFIVIYLNQANKMIGHVVISEGGKAGTVADPKMILGNGLIMGASGMILSHNHPSGNTKPSRQDIDLTEKLKNGAKLLDMAVLDHVILTADSHYSFGDEGML